MADGAEQPVLGGALARNLAAQEHNPEHVRVLVQTRRLHVEVLIVLEAVLGVSRSIAIRNLVVQITVQEYAMLQNLHAGRQLVEV